MDPEELKVRAEAERLKVIEGGKQPGNPPSKAAIAATWIFLGLAGVLTILVFIGLIKAVWSMVFG